MGTTEIVTASLRGAGHSVECSLMVTHCDVQRNAGPAYARFVVLEAPALLRDGYYEAAFDGHSAFLHRANGSWSVGIPWRQFQPGNDVAPARSKENLV